MGEYVPLFRSCLELVVVERVNQVLLAKGKTWDNVTIEQLKTYMKSEFGSRQTEVENVIKMWGPSRLTKRKDETAADHYFRYKQGFPECLKPKTDAEKERYIDLMNRSMYFISVNDDYLQKELSNLKKSEPTEKDFFDEVCAAEARLNTYNDITKATVAAEGSGTVAVSYANAKTGNKNKANKTGTKPKEFDPKKNANIENKSTNQNKNSNQKSNQNSDKQKSNPKQQNKSKKKLYCKYHKENSSHTSKDCYFLKRNKSINKTDGCESDDENSENLGNMEFAEFHSITAVTPSIKSFATMKDSHPFSSFFVLYSLN